MSTPTYCYFGPMYVPLSKLAFAFALLVLIQSVVGTARTDARTLRARRLYLRAVLVCFIAPPMAVMAMALHWYATVDYVSAMAYVVQGPADPFLPVLRVELLWFIARPAIVFTLLLTSLHIYQTRTSRLNRPSPAGGA